MIEKPTIETRQYLEDASACQWYFFNKNLKNIRGYKQRRSWRKDHVGRLGVKLEDTIFNTKQRILRRFEFNRACSGGIYNIRDANLSACRTDIDALGE
jgi:predicted adenine nucleotide alpha hydrolase (AANH) superfamily ATPase